MGQSHQTFNILSEKVTESRKPIGCWSYCYKIL